MSTLLYLAYGSNLHPVRLGERVPSARLLGTVALPGFRLAFHVRGRDDSGKGNLVASTEAPPAYGAVYEISAKEKPDLDCHEGDSYRVTTVEVDLNGSRRSCFTYVGRDAYIDDTLRPFDWYRNIILLGARHLGVPDTYVDMIHGVECQADPDAARATLHGDLMQRILAWDPAG